MTANLSDIGDAASRETIEALIDAANVQHWLSREPAGFFFMADARPRADLRPAAARLRTYPWFFQSKLVGDLLEVMAETDPTCDCGQPGYACRCEDE